MRKRKRKIRLRPILSMILTVFIIIGPYYFLVHRPNSPGQDPPEELPQWTGIISFWDYPRLDQKSGSSYGWISEKIKAFEKKYPGVYIDFHGLSWDKGPEKLEAALTSGNLPDILPVGSDYRLIGENVLQPLDPYLTVEEIRSFDEKALRAVTYDGKIWAMPWMMTTYGMVLNVDLFQQRGVELPPGGNWTHEEFVDKLKQLTYDSKGKGTFDHFGINSFIQADYYNLWGIILGEGGEIFNQQMDYIFNDERAKAGVQRLIDLKEIHQVTHPDFGINNSNKAWTSFYQGKNVAAIPTGTWSINVLENLKNEGKGFNYSVAAYPTGSLGKPVAMGNMVGSYGVTLQQDPEKLKLCIEFLQLLVEDEYQIQLNRLGVFPVKKHIGNIYEGDPHMAVFYENLQNTVILPPHPKWREIDTIIQEEILYGLRGEKTAEALLKDAEVRVRQLLGS